MKIILVDKLKQGHFPNVHVFADSSLLRHGEPLFLGAETEEFTSSLVPAVRIGRLGTHIPAKFAADYIDAVSFMHLLAPKDSGSRFFIPWCMSDRMLSPGMWLSKDTVSDYMLDITVSSFSRHNPFEAEHFHPVDEKLFFEQAPRLLAELSRYGTFKTGDIIMSGEFGVNLGTPRNDSYIDAMFGPEHIMHLKIK